MECPRSIVLVMLALASAAAMREEPGEAADRSIYRSNSGVVFEHVGEVSPSARSWYHSFVVAIPRMEDLVSADVLRTLRRDGTDNTENLLKRTVMDKITSLNSLIMRSLPHLWTRRSLYRKGKHSVLLDFLGSQRKSLFGTATYDDVVKVTNKVSRLVPFGEDLKAGLISQEKTMESYMKVNNSRIDKILAIINTTAYNVEHLEELIQQHSGAISLLAASERKYTDSMVRLAAHTFAAMAYIQDLMQAVNSLAVGILPRNMVTEQMLNHVIGHLTEKYADVPSVNVLHRDPNYYYSHGSVLAQIVGDKDIWITVKIPMGTNMNYDLYKVSTFQVPMGEHTTIIKNLPDYVMVSKDRQLVQELNQRDIDGCDGHYTRYCPFPTEVSIIQESSTCVSALLRKNNQLVNKRCDIVIRKDSNIPTMKQLTNFRFMVSNFDSIKVRCHTAPTEVTQEGCKFCLMDVPCNCRVRAGEFVYVTPISSRCPNGPESDYDQFMTRFHLSNQHVLTELFRSWYTLFPFPEDGFPKDQTEEIKRKFDADLHAFLAQDDSREIKLKNLRERAKLLREKTVTATVNEHIIKAEVSVNAILVIFVGVLFYLIWRLKAKSEKLNTKMNFLDRSVESEMWDST